MRCLTISLVMAVVIGHAALCLADSTTLDVWPGKPPGETGSIAAEKATTEIGPGGTKAVTSLTNVSKPTLSVWRPEAAKNTGAAVLVFPGGGYNVLAWDHEGEQVARWLNSIGVTAAVLKYRVPRREGTPRDMLPVQPLMDAQRAISLVRGKAAEWGIDAKRIGVLGFSAGGHLAARVAINYAKRAYHKIDATDEVSCRPDFAVLIYAGGVVKRGTTELLPEYCVTPQTPPCFFALAADDGTSPENSIAMYLALKRAGVPAELHVYASGGHGFGMRATGKPAATWPRRCEEWMRDMKLLPPPKKPGREVEPLLKEFSMSKAAEYLDAGSRDNTIGNNTSKGCIACHGAYVYLAARPLIALTTSAPQAERLALEGLATKRAAQKSDPQKADAGQVCDTILAAAVLAQDDALTHKKLQPLSRKALDHMWDLQREDGRWNWDKANEPSSTMDDHFGVTVAAIAAGTAPDGYANTPQARKGLEGIRRYLREHAPTTMHQRGMLLLASGCVQGVLTDQQRGQGIADLFALQRPDGGWSMSSLGDWKRKDGWPLDRTVSDGYGTGFCVFVLRRGGRIPANDPRLRKGVAWLKSHQRASGCWYTHSPSKSDELASYVGSTYAILALHACGEL